MTAVPRRAAAAERSVRGWYAATWGLFAAAVLSLGACGGFVLGTWVPAGDVRMTWWSWGCSVAATVFGAAAFGAKRMWERACRPVIAAAAYPPDWPTLTALPAVRYGGADEGEADLWTPR